MITWVLFVEIALDVEVDLFYLTGHTYADLYYSQMNHSCKTLLLLVELFSE